MSNDEVKQALKDWGEAKKTADDANDKLDECRRKVLELVGDRNIVYGDYSIKHLERKGVVNYDQIPELKNVDLDKYRKPTVKYSTISRKT